MPRTHVPSSPVAGPPMTSAGGYGSIPPSGGYGSAPICRFLLYDYIMFSLQSSQYLWQDHPCRLQEVMGLYSLGEVMGQLLYVDSSLTVPLYHDLSTVVPVPVAGPSMPSTGGYGSIQSGNSYGSAPICRFFPNCTIISRSLYSRPSTCGRTIHAVYRRLWVYTA